MSLTKNLEKNIRLVKILIIYELFNIQPKSKIAYDDLVRELMVDDESMLYVEY